MDCWGERVIKEIIDPKFEEPYRSQFRRDYARLVHSPSFRRLQGKTQLFPWFESDIFRNRLIHSLEVAQIAKSIAIRINNVYLSKPTKEFIDADLVEFAALAHDLGHPPFGHIGEKILDELMINAGGFEGNAQTLRLLAKQEKKHLGLGNEFWMTTKGKDNRIGLNLTYRSLASILKYDMVIPKTKDERLTLIKGTKAIGISPYKGYYLEEQDLVSEIKSKVGGQNIPKSGFKTIECKIMDIADDIAYSTYDLEDGLKARFYNPLDITFANKKIIKKVAQKLSEKLGQKFDDKDVQKILIKIFKLVFTLPDYRDVKINNKNFFDFFIYNLSGAYRTAKELSKNGFYRTELTSEMVGRFIRGVEMKIDKKNIIFSKVFLSTETLIEVETLKLFNYYTQIMSPKLKIIEYRGQEIIKCIFTALSSKGGHKLFPEDYQDLYEKSSKENRRRIICDYISGMTDNFCLEFYGRLTSEHPETIFKPVS